MEESPAAETRLAEAAAHLGPAPGQAEAAPAVDLAVVGMGDEVAVASRSVARSWSANMPRSHGCRQGPDGPGPLPCPAPPGLPAAPVQRVKGRTARRRA